MKFPIGTIASVATRAAIAIASSIPVVQAAQGAFKAGTGAEKKAAVLDVVRTELAAAELVAGHDLANDQDVLAAAGAVNDAIVALHKVLAAKVHAATT